MDIFYIFFEKSMNTLRARFCKLESSAGFGPATITLPCNSLTCSEDNVSREIQEASFFSIMVGKKL